MWLFRLLKPRPCHPSQTVARGKRYPLFPISAISVFHSSNYFLFRFQARGKSGVGEGLPRGGEIRGRLDWPFVLWMALKRPVYHLCAPWNLLPTSPLGRARGSVTYIQDVSHSDVWSFARPAASRGVARIFARVPRGSFARILLTTFDTENSRIVEK